MHAVIALALSLATVLLAGCAGGGTAKTQNIQLSYNGDEPGTHTRQASCDADGQTNIVSQINEGEITVTVRDGENKEVFHRTFTGNLDGETQSLDGGAGTWTLQVDRSEDFRGSYTVTLNC